METGNANLSQSGQPAAPRRRRATVPGRSARTGRSRPAPRVRSGLTPAAGAALVPFSLVVGAARQVSVGLKADEGEKDEAEESPAQKGPSASTTSPAEQ